MENSKETNPAATPQNEAEGMPQNADVMPEHAPPSPDIHPIEETAFPVEKKPTPAWLRKSLPWAVVIAVSLLIGFGLAYFLLYVPAEQARFEASRQVSLQSEQIEKLEADLSQTQEQLTETQNRLEETASELSELQYNAALTALQNNITYARLALITKDMLTARQELSSASSNLTELIPLLGDEEVETALSERLAVIRSSLVSDPEKSLEELRTLSENLSRLEKP